MYNFNKKYWNEFKIFQWNIHISLNCINIIWSIIHNFNKNKDKKEVNINIVKKINGLKVENKLIINI